MNKNQTSLNKEMNIKNTPGDKIIKTLQSNTT